MQQTRLSPETIDAVTRPLTTLAFELGYQYGAQGGVYPWISGVRPIYGQIIRALEYLPLQTRERTHHKRMVAIEFRAAFKLGRKHAQ